MLAGLYIIVDDDFSHPIYADPERAELDPLLWEAAVEALQDAFDDEGPMVGCVASGEHRIAWRVHGKMRVSIVVIVEDSVSEAHATKYVKDLQDAYFAEVDDVREPDREGVEDVIIDVVAPWEDEEED
jgi:hypothetical protein